MQQVHEDFESILKAPNLDRLQLTDEEKDQLAKLILRALKEQLNELATILIKAWHQIKELPNAKSLLKLSILDCDLTQEQLEIIFRINTILKEEDQQLRGEIAKLKLQPAISQQAYELVYQFRHFYLLDKKKQFYQHCERLDQRLLHLRNGIAQYFLDTHTNFSPEEKALVNKAYPRRGIAWHLNANRDFTLSLKVMMLFIVEIAQKLIGTKQFIGPDDKITIANLKFPSDSSYKIYHAYTNSAVFDLLNTPEQLQARLATDTSILKAKHFLTGGNLLTYAIEKESETLVKILINAGADPNSTDASGRNALHLATNWDNRNVFDLILPRVSNINAECHSGYTALHLAAWNNKDDYVVDLLALGANPNLNNNAEKATALHLCTANSNDKLVKLLLTNKKIDPTIPNVVKKTPADIAKNNNFITQLFNDYFKEKQLMAAAQPSAPKIPAIAPAPKVAPPAPKQQINIIDFYQKALAAPRAYRDQLNKIVNSNADNPFLNYTCKEASDREKLDGSLISEIESEQQTNIKVHDFFKKIRSSLGDLKDNLKDKSGATFGEAYIRICELTQDLLINGMPRYAFCYELVRYEFIEHLINLLESKSEMAVAIEEQDIRAINAILKKEPNRALKTIMFANVEYSEIKFAIQMGRVTAVREMLRMKTEIPDVNFGEVPDNPVELAQKQHTILENTNPALLEAQIFHSTDIPLASRNNWRRLMYTLLKTLPKDQPVVNHFFTKEEYDCVRVLLSEKDIPLQQKIDERTKRNIQAKILLAAEKRILPKKIARLKAQLTSEQDPKVRKKLVEEIAIFEALPHKIDDALARIQRLSLPENMTQAVTQSHNELSAPPDAPLIINEYIHATDKATHIIEQGKILTVKEAIIATKARSGTPEGARNNIFFNINSPLTRITPFRSAVNALVKLNPIKAIRNGLLKPNDIYCSPHLSAFDIERVENPIMFIGEDPSIVTVYRICHIIDPLTKAKKKVHRFDYYKDGKLIYPSTVVDFKLAEEFFRGDNTKSLTYRLLLILRWIQGPFASGSYRDYFLKNINNATVINSLKAAIFNVFNIEGKISKSIENIDNDAIEIIENPKARHFETLSQDTLTGLFKLIDDGNLAGLQNTIRDFALYKEQLGAVLVQAAKQLKPHIVQYLLEIGVSCSHQNNAALYQTLLILQSVANKGEHHPDIRAAHDILLLLLERGSKDEYDQHIRYPATPDSCTNSNATWSDTSKSNLEFLQDCLQAFEGTELQKLLISHINKPLQELYQFTFQKGLFNSHIDIAKRLNQKTLFERADIAAQLQLIDDNNTQEIEALFRSTQEPEQYAYLLYWAIKQEQSTLFPFFTRYLMSSKTWMNQAITFAIKNKSNKFIRFISSENQIGLDTSSYDLVLKYSLNNLSIEETAAFISKIGNLQTILITALNQKNYPLALFIIDHCNLEGQVFHYDSPDNLAKRIKELLEAAVTTKVEKILEAITAKIISFPILHSIHIKEIYMCLRKVIEIDSSSFTIILDTIKANKKEDVFAKHFITTEDRSCTISKQMNNTLEYLIALATPKNLERLLSFISQCQKYNLFFTQLKNTENKNYLHICLAYNSPEALKVMQANFPAWKLLTPEFTALKLYETIIKEHNPKIRMLDELLSQRIDLPTPFNERIRLLAMAALIGNKHVIDWFFEKNYLSKDNVDEKTNKNIPQLLLHQINILKLEMQNDTYFDDESLTTSLSHMILKYNINLEHQDNEGKTLVFYPLSKPFIELLIARKYNFAVRDANGNTPFHFYELKYITLEMLKKYCELGGDLTALNSNSVSILERYLVSKPHSLPGFTAILDKFKAVGAKTRSVILPETPEYSILTYRHDEVLQLLTANVSCLFNPDFFAKRIPLLSPYLKKFTTSDGTLFTIAHYDFGKTRKLIRSVKKNLSEQVKASWVPYTEATQPKSINPSALPEKQHQTSSKVVTLLLEDNEDKKILIDQRVEALVTAYHAEHEPLRKLYQLIMIATIEELQKYLQDHDIANRLKSSPFQFYAYYLKYDQYHIIRISPLTFAIMCGRNEITKFLLSQGLATHELSLNMENKRPQENPLRITLDFNNAIALDILLASKHDLDFSLLTKLLRLIPNPLLPDFLPILLKHANRVNHEKFDTYTNSLVKAAKTLLESSENNPKFTELKKDVARLEQTFNKVKKRQPKTPIESDEDDHHVAQKKSKTKVALQKRKSASEVNLEDEPPKLARQEDKDDRSGNGGGTTRFFLRRKPAEALPHSSKKNRLDEEKDDSSPSVGSSPP